MCPTLRLGWHLARSASLPGKASHRMGPALDYGTEIEMSGGEGEPDVGVVIAGLFSPRIYLVSDKRLNSVLTFSMPELF